MVTRVGMVSDTHGKLPAGVIDIFSGKWGEDQLIARTVMDVAPEQFEPNPAPVDQVIHAGDIGSQAIIDKLETCAPVIACLGNCDHIAYWSERGEITSSEVFNIEGVSMALFHRPAELRIALQGVGPDRPPRISPLPHIGIHGHNHTHEAVNTPLGWRVSPGSPTEPRQGQLPSVMVLYLEDGKALGVDTILVR